MRDSFLPPPIKLLLVIFLLGTIPLMGSPRKYSKRKGSIEYVFYKKGMTSPVFEEVKYTYYFEKFGETGILTRSAGDTITSTWVINDVIVYNIKNDSITNQDTFNGVIDLILKLNSVNVKGFQLDSLKKYGCKHQFRKGKYLSFCKKWNLTPSIGGMSLSYYKNIVLRFEIRHLNNYNYGINYSKIEFGLNKNNSVRLKYILGKAQNH